MTKNKKDEDNVQVILIDIDVLLDTRLATLLLIDDEWVGKVIDNGYRARESDVWSKLAPGIDQEEYDNLYKNRDVNTLALSRLTSFMPVLLDIVKQYEYTLTLEPDTLREAFIVINTHPYELEESNLADIVFAVKEYIGEMVQVKITHEPFERLSVPYMVDTGYTQYITYNFTEWCEHHFGNGYDLEKPVELPHFSIVAPKVFKREISEEHQEELEQYEMTDEDPYGLLQMLFASTFELTFMPVEAYSLISHDMLNPKEHTPPEE